MFRIVEGTGAPERDEWSSERESLTMEYPAPHVIVFRFRGHTTVRMLPFMEGTFRRRVLAAGVRPIIFSDTSDVVAYESALRLKGTEWAVAAHRKFGTTFHILVRSRVVAMGVSAARVITGNTVRAYTEHRDFEDAIAKAIRSTPVPLP
jgi:hypothetical protein